MLKGGVPTLLFSMFIFYSYKIIERNEASRLSEAFHSGKSSSLFQFSVKTGIERSHLNRYRNVWPFDHNRVKITSSSSSASDNEDDYINASYINIPLYPTSSSAFPPQDPILSSTTANFKTFISTQAPLSSTTSVFWKMVFDHNTPVIIMLSNTNQDYLTQQCYWPSITDKMILPTVELVVENIEEHTLHENHQIIIRKFKISSSNLQQHTVTHIQYLDWADHFIPGNILSLFQIRDLVNKLRSNDCTAARSNDQSDYIISPLSSRSNFLAISTTAPQNAACHVVIHCSAGCGRTGVYMVIDTLLECLESQETRLIEKEPDTCTDIIFHLVELLRKQRVLTVQTFAQYVFCYEALLKFSLGC